MHKCAMRPVHGLGRCLCLLGAAVACREAADAPPAARLTAATPRPAASARSPESTERDRVSLDGGTRAPPIHAAGGGPRIYAKALRAWIHARPSRGSERLGALRAGTSLPVLGRGRCGRRLPRRVASGRAPGLRVRRSDGDARPERSRRSAERTVPPGLLAQAPVRLRHGAQSRSRLRAAAERERAFCRRIGHRAPHARVAVRRG